MGRLNQFGTLWPEASSEPFVALKGGVMVSFLVEKCHFWSGEDLWTSLGKYQGPSRGQSRPSRMAVHNAISKLTMYDWFICTSTTADFHKFPCVAFFDQIAVLRIPVVVLVYTLSDPTWGPYMWYQNSKHFVLDPDTVTKGLKRRAACPGRLGYEASMYI